MRPTLRQALAAFVTAAMAAPSGPQDQDPAANSTSSKPLLRDFDALGAWFEGVDAIEAKTDPAARARANRTTVAIVGAGVAGLATALMLDSVGVHGWELIEAGPRVGGRLRTVSGVGGTDEWAEMGPMRLPRRLTFASDGATLEYSDHAMVWQLADELNARNAAAGRDDLRVDFIPWIQHSPNELLALGTGRLPGGRIPTRAEVAADPEALAEPAPLDTDEYRAVKARMDGILKDEATLRAIVRDPWRAHRRAMDQGLDDVSQQAMMRNVWGASAEVTDAIRTATDYDVFWDEMTHNANLAQDGGSGALATTEWWCVDRGFSRIGEAFLPHVRDRLVLNRQVRKIEAVPSSSPSSARGGNATRLSWIDSSPADRANQTTAAPGPAQHRDYDYAVVSAPFTATRMMDLPDFSPQLTRAMSERGLRFKDACKVALLFRERFWERGDRPIFGGKSEPADAAMGALYYPVYGLNETTASGAPRPGLIVQYRGGDWSSRFTSALTPDEHAARALDAVASLHGPIARDLYAGTYARQCWLAEPSVASSWARPAPAQHRTYIPAYHATEHGTLFVGEHTAPTHAWLSSSLHSAARGAVQLLLEMGLVDEAKKINREWMGRWL